MKGKKKFKVKKLFKNSIFTFVLGLFLASVISVSAASLLLSSDVTYDNSSSGLSATTVQDALDELYEQASSCPVCDSEGKCTVICPSDKPNYISTTTGYKCSAGVPITDLTKKVVTTGDGLYADSTESGRYVYKGASPNNYITFSGSTWRILAVETDGTLKIMKQDSIGYMDYDSNRSGAWSSATLNTYLNGTYYNTLDSTYIQNHSFNVGNVSSSSSLTTTINQEKAKTWTGNIALANVSDYIKSNTNTSSCGSISSNNSNKSTCKTSSFIGRTTWWPWLLSMSTSVGQAWFVYDDGEIREYHASSTNGVYPVLYLSSSIALSGKGTSDEPYKLS